jgi:hypothetical protein
MSSRPALAFFRGRGIFTHEMDLRGFDRDGVDRVRAFSAVG